MEVHPRVNSLMAKRLWNLMKIAFFMIRKLLIPKRKLMTDLNLMMRRAKFFLKSLSNVLSHHHNHLRPISRGGFGIQDYEFSCSNSPNPVFFHAQRRKYCCFPCINPPRATKDDVYDDEGQHEAKAVAMVPKTPEHAVSFPFDEAELASGEKRSPLLFPFSIRVAEYSSEVEENDGENKQVDAEAEEFIKSFYERLRAQSHNQLLQYQETEFQEMLARGA